MSQPICAEKQYSLIAAWCKSTEHYVVEFSTSNRQIFLKNISHKCELECMNRRLKQGINLIFTNLTICYRGLIQAELSTVKQFPFLWVPRKNERLCKTQLAPCFQGFPTSPTEQLNAKFKLFLYWNNNFR